MLELKQITKEYSMGEETVHALKGVDLQFRTNEFVSILGPSGCGKTTMLNIIGGLDGYTSGDLIINGKSTKDFKDRDWDTYRNHTIGFVFQSYNLIPHQTVLSNVELALTLSGVPKKERRERAKKALEQVGLGGQLYKKPKQMSGGQMQRVAIARALVNNPDIILADEPTGALDTETSVQVMEILKEISKDKLIIMVTHNPDLANKYSTRIINILDGEIKDDSMPLTEEEIKKEKEAEKTVREANDKKKKPSMKLLTAFSLSLKNLITKMGRTALTSFAGSIGIIGIALIFAVSNGMTTYISDVQENALSSYPLTIESSNIDITSLMETFMGIAESKNEHENDAVYKKSAIFDMVNALSDLKETKNDLTSFKKFIEEEKDKEDSKLNNALSGVSYSYDLDLLVYTKNVDGEIIASDAEKVFQDMLTQYVSTDPAILSLISPDGSSESASMSIMSGSNIVTWQEMLPGDDDEAVSDVVKKQYDLVYGSWPSDYNQVVLVLDENNELDDLTLYALGLKSSEDINKIMDAAINKEKLDENDEKWSYEEICEREYRVILNSSCYSLDPASGKYVDLRDTQTGIKYLYDNGISLKVSGIIKPNEDSNANMLSGSIAYTSKLTEYVINAAKDSDAINAQLKTPSIDIFTNLPFKESTGSLSKEEKKDVFLKYVDALDKAGKANVYVSMMSIPDSTFVEQSVAQIMSAMDRTAMDEMLIAVISQQMGAENEQIRNYVTSMSDEDVKEMIEQAAAEQVKMQYAESVKAQLSSMKQEELVGALSASLPDYTAEQYASFYDEILEFSDSSYDKNLLSLGYIDLEKPAAINLYASTFENKDIIKDVIEQYNKDVDDISKLSYTDYVGIMMSSVSTIINAITYVLIAFVAISLIVSSIMIGVITLISVQERTKEIGILRAMGASKKNVSSMFNAETIIIGFTSGLLGVILTYLFCIPINAIIHALTGINSLNAFLPVGAAITLVIISVLLTLISGFIPSRSAAKKDPVVALRTE
ncbi:MAG: ATP-binding cassette domain-containing protein [Lachnospira sp.]